MKEYLYKPNYLISLNNKLLKIKEQKKDKSIFIKIISLFKKGKN